MLSAQAYIYAIYEVGLGIAGCMNSLEIMSLRQLYLCSYAATWCIQHRIIPLLHQMVGREDLYYCRQPHYGAF